MAYKKHSKKTLQERALLRYRSDRMNIEPVRQLLFKPELSDADTKMLEAFMNMPNGKILDLCVYGNVVYNAEPIKRTTHRIKRKKSNSDK